MKKIKKSVTIVVLAGIILLVILVVTLGGNSGLSSSLGGQGIELGSEPTVVTGSLDNNIGRYNLSGFVNVAFSANDVYEGSLIILDKSGEEYTRIDVGPFSSRANNLRGSRDELFHSEKGPYEFIVETDSEDWTVTLSLTD